MAADAIAFGGGGRRQLARKAFVDLAFTKEMGVELGLSLAECGVRSSCVEALLAMTTTRTLHHVDGLEVEVTNVGVGWILGQPDSLQEVYVAKWLVRFAAPQTAETV